MNHENISSWKGFIWIIKSKSPFHAGLPKTKPQRELSRNSLNSDRLGVMTNSQGSLFQCQTTLSVKNLFPMSTLNFPDIPHVPSLATREKVLSIKLLPIDSPDMWGCSSGYECLIGARSYKTDTHFSISSHGRGTAGDHSITSAFSHLDSHVPGPLLGQSLAGQVPGVPEQGGGCSSRVLTWDMLLLRQEVRDRRGKCESWECESWELYQYFIYALPKLGSPM